MYLLLHGLVLLSLGLVYIVVLRTSGIQTNSSDMLDILFVYHPESPWISKMDLLDISAGSTHFLEVQRTIDLQVFVCQLQIHVLVYHLVATSNQEVYRPQEIGVVISYAPQELVP